MALVLPEGRGVRDGYDRWAEIYDVEENPVIGLEDPFVAEALGDVAGLDALDLGCGTGRHTMRLVGAGATVTAVDFSPRMLEAARAKPGADHVRFVMHDMHQPLPLPAAAFDLVVSGLVLEHLVDLRAFFGEAARVLRPGGRGIFSGMHPAMFLRGVQARFHDPRTGETVQPGSVAHSIADFVTAMLGAGFTLTGLHEQAPDAAFASRCARAERYVGWPMLVVLQGRMQEVPPV